MLKDNKTFYDKINSKLICFAGEGDDKFINQLQNFMLNYQLSSKAYKIKGLNLVYCLTTHDKICKALELEGYMKHYLESKNEEASLSYGEVYRDEHLSSYVNRNIYSEILRLKYTSGNGVKVLDIN